MLAASAEVGAIHAGAGSRQRSALARYGRALGLAFQIADDILDRTSTAAELGKTPGKDRKAGKATYPGMFGGDDSRALAKRLAREAIEALEPEDLIAAPLAALAQYAASRGS